MKIDWNKEIKLPKLRRPSSAKTPGETQTPKSRRSSISRISRPKLPLPSRSKPSRSSEPAAPSRSASKVRRPALGGPELHAPKFLADLFADLRDRRLLPLVGVLIVAMVAAPILLSKASGHEEEASQVAPISEPGEASDANFDVVPAGHGLRDYKRRLAHRNALDPFRGVAGSSSSRGKKAKSSSETSGEGPAGEPETSVAGSSEVGSEPMATVTVGNVTKEVPAASVESRTGSSGSETKSGGKPSLRKPSRVTHTKSTSSESTSTESTTVESGGSETTPQAAGESTSSGSTTPGEKTEAKESTEPTHAETAPAKPAAEPSKPSGQAVEVPPAQVVGFTIDAVAGFLPHASKKTELQPMTKLPNAKHPLVLFVGLSKNHKRALFLMTSKVTAFYGGHCALEKQACQLVEVGPGHGVTFAAGYGESRYKLHLKKIVPTINH
jgi:hypothetical protein